MRQDGDNMLDLTSFKKSYQSFIRAQNVFLKNKQLFEYTDPDLIETLRAGVIQNFEFCYEFSWKFMKRWIENNVSTHIVDGVPRRELFRIAAENKLIDDVHAWMDFHRGRNISSHTYDEITAETVIDLAIKFIPFVEYLIEEIEKRNI